MENKTPNNEFDGLINALKSVTLTDAEKTYIKNVLLNSVEDAVVRNPEPTRPIYARSLLTNIFFKRMPIALAIMMFLGGGVSFAAEGSLPGSLLYPVKTEVNERFGEVLAFSTEAKAKFEAKLADRRAEEMEKLSKKGEMSPERAAELKAKFELHAEKARERMSKLEANGNLGVAIEAHSDIRARLKARAEAMADIEGDSNDESKKKELRKWLLDIRDEDGRFSEAELRIENKLKLDVSAEVGPRAEGKLKAAENKIEEVAKFITERKDDVKAEVVVKAETQLDLAEKNVADGKLKLEAKAYGEAFILFNKAHFAAMSAKKIIIDYKDRADLLDARIRVDEKFGRERHEDTEAEDSDDSDEEVSGEARVKINSGKSDIRGGVKLKVGL